MDHNKERVRCKSKVKNSSIFRRPRIWATVRIYLQLSRAWRTCFWKNFTVSHREGHRQFLRVLLYLVTEANIFLDMCTYQRTFHATYYEACPIQGLLAGDDKWRRTVHVSFTSAFVPLSQVFAALLAHCYPAGLKWLFINSQNTLIEDIKDRSRR